MNNSDKQKVTPEEIRKHAREVYNQSWEIQYKGAQCKFETTSPEDAVLYDLEVPRKTRNQGIGSSMVRTAEEIIRERTSANVLYAQVGASDGSTRHVLEEKCEFEIVGEEYSEELGKIVDAMKQLD